MPAYFLRFGKGQFGALDQAGKPLPEFRAAIALEAELTVRDQFEGWLASKQKFHCQVSDRLFDCH